VGQNLRIATMTDLTAQQILDAMHEAVTKAAKRFGQKKKPIKKLAKSMTAKNGKQKLHIRTSRK